MSDQKREPGIEWIKANKISFYTEEKVKPFQGEEENRLFCLKIGETALYPHQQFDVDPSTLEIVRVRRQVLEVWDEVVAPCLEAGLIDEFSAYQLMFQKGDAERISLADEIASHEQSREELDQIKHELRLDIYPMLQ